MMNSSLHIFRICLGATVISAAMLTSCATERTEETASSGSPEADQRADQRIGSSKDSKAKPDRTLYERLGGSQTITALVEDMTARCIADPRVNFERQNVRTGVLGRKYKAWDPNPQNIERFKQHLVEFLTLASGGPSQYTGREMSEVHDGMKITNNEFDAFVGDIKASMDNLGIGTREKRDVLAIVETTRKQIVEQQ